MTERRGALIAGCALALLTVVPGPFAWSAGGQTAAGEPGLTFSSVESLGLPPAQASQLKQAVEARDYIAAEKLLLAEINRDPRSAHAARLLAFDGGIYFLDEDYLNAAIAWNKSAAIAPLPPQLKFSLAMTYVRIGHSDWARGVLKSLAKENPKEALYPYWLGRLDYDAQSYSEAILHFEDAIGLAPDMARAYDSLGLCFYYQNRNALAVENYKKAIELDRSSPHPSPWPYLNLAVTLQFMNQPGEAEADLREAIRLDPTLAPAHFQLGNILEAGGKTEAAIGEFREAARLDSNYAEPHFALARIYRKLGQQSAAKQEVEVYLRIHARSNIGTSSMDNPSR